MDYVITDPRKSLTVKVPATVANIGSGFDAIGIALNIWNTLTVTVSPTFEMLIEGEGAEELPRDDNNLIIHGMKAAFIVGERLKAHAIAAETAAHIIYTEGYASQPIPVCRYECKNEIPFGRGMGSSSAAIISGLIAGFLLQGIILPMSNKEILLNIACALEGHPDNVAPALYGGIQVGVKAAVYPFETPKKAIVTPVHWTTSRIPISHKLQCIIFVAGFTQQTSEARAVLPKMVRREDAIFNLSRTALLVQAFVTGTFDLLRIAMDDRLHQPARSKSSMPHIMPIIQAAVDAGAYGACLAGAGPSILAFAKGDDGNTTVKTILVLSFLSIGDIFKQIQNHQSNQLIGDAMLDAALRQQINGKIRIVKPTHRGAYIFNENVVF